MSHEPLIIFAYIRLSNEDFQKNETIDDASISRSVANQKRIIDDFAERVLRAGVAEYFIDDGYSGGNFNRPNFQRMLRALESGGANCVVVKDLSRLGRSMNECSYYAEVYFPEHGVWFRTVADNFDSRETNTMAPFQYAMNEVYLRDGSKKVRQALQAEREHGIYCACPPYGYEKSEADRSRLQPDPATAPIVRRIFEAAARGDSTRAIAMELSRDGVIPPLKYRAEYRDHFSEEGMRRVSDVWNGTTIKRILKNEVYLGHTLLGKSKKVSFKSKKKIALPRAEWCIVENTHPPLVGENLFRLAQRNLGRGAPEVPQGQVRKSIFSGVAVCALCGHALCSAGTVYKGEREAYWYLTCTHKRKDIASPCPGVRIRYADLTEVVRRELNALIAMDDAQVAELVRGILRAESAADAGPDAARRREAAEARLDVIERAIRKLYLDNIEGRISDELLHSQTAEFEREAKGLRQMLAELARRDARVDVQQNFARFFDLAKQYTTIRELDRDTLLTFVERIEVGPKLLPEGAVRATHRAQPFRQSIRISYRFIGSLEQQGAPALPAGKEAV